MSREGGSPDFAAYFRLDPVVEAAATRLAGSQTSSTDLAILMYGYFRTHDYTSAIAPVHCVLEALRPGLTLQECRLRAGRLRLLGGL